MRKDPTEFRKRFAAYKEGKMPYEAGRAIPAYEDGLTPHKKSEVNTNEATYNPEEDLYTGRYTVPEVTVTGRKSKVGTGYGKRLYMHPWKTVGDLIAEENAARPSVEERAARAPYENDLHKPLSPVDPIGELIVGNAVGSPVFNYVGKGLSWAGNTIVDDALVQAGKSGSKWAKAKAVQRTMRNPVVTENSRLGSQSITTTDAEWYDAIKTPELNPDQLADDFVRRNRGASKYIQSIADDIYGLSKGLNIVDRSDMNKYGRVFNERIKKTLPLAKQRGTLRTEIEPNVVVADNEGRRILYDTFINDTRTITDYKGATIHIGDPITDKGKLAARYYYMTKPPKDIYDKTPSSFADRVNNTVVLVPRTGYENMYKYSLPHEKTHIFIDGKKEAELFGTDRGFGVRPRKAGDVDIGLDLYLARPDEQLARGTQIKNYLGITDESPITPRQLKYAAENYVKDTGHNNNMTDFFSTIKDYDKAAKWLSMAPTLTPWLIGTGTFGTLYGASSKTRFKK